MLAANTLIGGGGNGGDRARAMCKLELLCSVARTTILGEGSGLKLLEQKP